MKLSSGSYPAAGYTSLHIFGVGTAKLFETLLVTQPSGKRTVFGSLPQGGVTACNPMLRNSRSPLVESEQPSHRSQASGRIAAKGRGQTTRSSCCSSETVVRGAPIMSFRMDCGARILSAESAPIDP